MDRQIVYSGEVPRSADFLGQAKNELYALGQLMQAVIGPNTGIAGLAIAPTSPSSLSFTIGSGMINANATVDSTPYGTLGSDANVLMKQGLLLSPQTLTITPPSTSGYSQVFLVQVGYSDVDSGAIVPPYFNSADPGTPFNGVGGLGGSQNTVRQGVLVVELKAGVAAPTGSQTVPSADAGFSPVYVITVANGASTVTSSNWYTHPQAPFYPNLESLKTSFLPIIPSTTFYVDPVNGSDSNPGTQVLPFKTMQACVNYASGFASAGKITINVLAGTITVPAHGTACAIGATQIASWSIVGAGVGTSIVDATATGAFGFTVVGNATVSITGFTIKAYYYCIQSNVASEISVGTVSCQMSSSISAALVATGSGILVVSPSTVTISGSGQAAILSLNRGFIQIGYHDVNQTLPASITFSGATVSQGTVVSQGGSLVSIDPTTTTFSGVPTGPKYNISTSSGVSTNGSTSIIPGSVAGTVNSATYGWLA